MIKSADSKAPHEVYLFLILKHINFKKKKCFLIYSIKQYKHVKSILCFSKLSYILKYFECVLVCHFLVSKYYVIVMSCVYVHYLDCHMPCRNVFLSNVQTYQCLKKVLLFDIMQTYCIVY